MNLSGYRHHNERSMKSPVKQGYSGSNISAKGVISEVTYCDGQPWVTQLVLLPLLQQLGQQSRWQLWLTPQQKLSRAWVETAGLPLAKVMQVNTMAPASMVKTMARALSTGNFSVVMGWINHELTLDERKLLTMAAEKGSAMGFILRPEESSSVNARPLSGLKIHSSLYH